MHIESSDFLLAVNNKDSEALARVFDLYASALYNYVLRYACDESLADNIVGDVFANFLESVHSGNEPIRRLRPYLYEIAYREFINATRYEKRVMPNDISLYPLSAHVANPVRETEATSQLEAVLEAMNSELTEYQRHVITLRFLEDFTTAETAEILGRTVDDIKVTQNRAVGRLRVALGVDLTQLERAPNQVGASKRSAKNSRGRRKTQHSSSKFLTVAAQPGLG